MQTNNSVELKVLIIAARQDQKYARQLMQHINRYRPPKNLIGSVNRDGVVAEKVQQVSLNLDIPLHTKEGEAALQSSYAVVICSPKATASKDVDNWTRQYKALWGAAKVLCYIVDGEPNASARKETAEQEAFPESIRFHVDKQANLLTERTEPIAADHRSQGDGPKNARLKLLAGIYAVRYEALKQRAIKQKRQRLALLSIAIGLCIGYLIFLLWQQHQSQKLVLQTELNKEVIDAFNALNSQQLEKLASHKLAIKTIMQGNNLEPHLFNSLKYREQLQLPPFQRVANNQKFDFLLASAKKHSIVALDNVEQQLRVTSDIDGVVSTHTYPIAFSEVNRAFATQATNKLLAAQLIGEDNLLLLIGDKRHWKSFLLDLNQKKILTSQQHAGELFTQFNNFKLNSSNLYFHEASLAQEWVMFNQDDTIYLKNLITPQNHHLADVEPEIIKDLLPLHFDQTRQIVYWYNPIRFTLYQWDATAQTFESIFTAKQTIESMVFSPDSNWVNLGFENASGQSHSFMLNLLSGQLTSQLDLRFVDLQLDKSNLVGRAMSSFSNLQLVEFMTDSSTINVRKKIEQSAIEYTPVFEKQAHQWYSIQWQTGKVLRSTPFNLHPLLTYSSNCAPSKQLPIMDKYGKLHCLDNQGKWLKYPLAQLLPQSTFDAEGNIHDFLPYKDGWLIVNNQLITSRLIEISQDKVTLTKQQQLETKDLCLGNILIDEDNILLSASQRKSLDMFGLNCAHGDDFQFHWLSTQNESWQLTPQPANHINLPLNLRTFENAKSRGLYVQPYEFSWYVNQKGELVADPKAVSDYLIQADTMPVGISKNITTEKLLLSRVIDAEEKKAQLELWDTQQQQLIKIIDENKSDLTNPKELFYQHGFTRNGQLAFWFKALNEETQIHWINFAGTSIVEKLPQSINSITSILRFSENSQFLLQLNMFSDDPHKVWRLKDGELMWQQAGSQNIEIHQSLPYIRLAEKVFSLESRADALSINYPESVSVTGFHPVKALAAGVCGNKVCVIDLQSLQVILLIEANQQAPIEAIKQVEFSKYGDQLIYVLERNILVTLPFKLPND